MKRRTMTEETLTVRKVYLDRLKEDSKFLAALHAAGVDNWEGYCCAQDDEEEEEED